MSGPEVTFVDLVRREMTDRGCPAQVLYGEEYVAQNDAPNRVVFEPSSRVERYLMPKPMQAKGPLPQSFAYWQAQGGANPRPLWTRVVTFCVHVWARATEQSDPKKQRSADQDALGALLNCVLAAVQTVAHGNVKPVGGAQLTKAKWDKAGIVYRLELEHEIPIVDADFPPGVIDSRAYTWPLDTAAADVRVSEVDAEGTTIESVTFTADPNLP